eukprot:9793679-Karenia_brevis.AAC.1
MAGAAWYTTDGPDLTHLVGTKKRAAECVDVSTGLPEAIFTNENEFQQLAEQLQLGLSVDDSYMGTRSCTATEDLTEVACQER